MRKRQNATTGPGDPADFAIVDPSDKPTNATRTAITPAVVARARNATQPARP